MSQSDSYTTYGRKLPRSTAAVRIEPKAAPWLVRHLNRLSRSCSKHSIRFSVSVIISARPSPCSTTTQRIPTLSSLPPVLRRRLRDARAHASVAPDHRAPDKVPSVPAQYLDCGRADGRRFGFKPRRRSARPLRRTPQETGSANRAQNPDRGSTGHPVDAAEGWTRQANDDQKARLTARPAPGRVRHYPDYV
jgi:hypothetical protein